MNPELNAYFENAPLWRNELKLLRQIALECEVEEVLKWKQPCYVYEGKNVFIIGAFKKHCTISFFIGTLLRDASSLLLKAGRNSQSVSMITFTSIEQIVEKIAQIKDYIQEAIQLEKDRKKVDFKAKKELVYPPELLAVFEEDKELAENFEKLTPGRKRGYILFITSSDNPEVRLQRIQKKAKRINMGAGVNECYCNRSKNMPYCDNTHKLL